MGYISPFLLLGHFTLMLHSAIYAIIKNNYRKVNINTTRDADGVAVGSVGNTQKTVKIYQTFSHWH